MSTPLLVPVQMQPGRPAGGLVGDVYAHEVEHPVVVPSRDGYDLRAGDVLDCFLELSPCCRLDLDGVALDDGAEPVFLPPPDVGFLGFPGFPGLLPACLLGLYWLPGYRVGSRRGSTRSIRSVRGSSCLPTHPSR